ncbi:Acyl-CoA synthetase (AMP-forming)/AMP-acid ligase II [Halobiforma haloterrestris]|uniref:Acyl-CoA synthetase (AMP-forming)/AMP-acid ligase II n=1 Tax=Natronobacterium haloterrestre TaxID=148448 RepID=A0A1I1HTC9_NATHA|nr:AMP-binding protein [Halobiforma haloterrestris]SFC24713.1 Acyl-CoA synthetase (AMP-forming)/AMP-acid ligase II [Halobiforma haloterrestris]
MTFSLARRADRHPDRTAVVDVSEERLYAPAETVHEDRLSYAELSRLADAVAGRLAARGIGAGDTVCLVSRNRAASLATLFACRRLGATLAPISHWLTPATVERPFAVLEPDLVVSERAQRDLVRSIPFDRSVTFAELAETESTDDPNASAPATDDAGPLLALHGDGGRPVATFSEATLEWNCVSAIVAWGISRTDVVPLLPPLSAGDALVRVALPVLYAGGELLLDRAFDPGDTVTAMAEREATLLSGRAGSLADLADDDRFPAALESVDRVLCEGAVPSGVRDTARETETPVARTFGRLECPTAFGGRLDSTAVRAGADPGPGEPAVGPPMPDCRVRLVEDGEPIPAGRAGEGRLDLAGRLVADGYVGPPGLLEPEETGPGEETDPLETVATGEGRPRFSDGWLETDRRVRRDGEGNYHPIAVED